MRRKRLSLSPPGGCHAAAGNVLPRWVPPLRMCLSSSHADRSGCSGWPPSRQTVQRMGTTSERACRWGYQASGLLDSRRSLPSCRRSRRAWLRLNHGTVPTTTIPVVDHRRSPTARQEANRVAHRLAAGVRARTADRVADTAVDSVGCRSLQSPFFFITNDREVGSAASRTR
jgi:hypothetical protein